MNDASDEADGPRQRNDRDEVGFRRAVAADVARIVELLAADPLGATREEPGEPLAQAYRDAFAAIDADPNQELIVATVAEQFAGVAQLTFIPSLTYRGSWRAQIEGVRVDETYRSRGLGQALIEHAVAQARERGCRLVQLTTDKQRPRALEFYERLGFVPSHVGMKLHLP